MTADHQASKSAVRGDYPHRLTIPTRWQDQDIYGHVNNVVYYAYFDTVINAYLISAAGFNPHTDPIIGICVESQCQFHREIKFPESIDAGLRVGNLGNSSVRYELGLFKPGIEAAAATGHFVHVFVDRAQRRPQPIPTTLRTALQRLAPSH